MTRKQFILGALMVFSALAIGLGSISRTGFQISSLFSNDFDAKHGELTDDPEGAMEYEFNMIKDPATGKIPEGIFDAERAQANDILQRQRELRTPEFASYSPVGPENLGGRTRSIVYDVRYNGTTNKTIFAGGISGGIYKSIDDGASWVRKSQTGDHFSCTDIVQDPRPGFQNTWYYAVGELQGSSAGGVGAIYLGNGVYKSTDNGETWARLPASNNGVLESFDNDADLISKIVVDPTNGNIYTAGISTIFRSTDGGATWAEVLGGAGSGTGQVTDVVVTSTGKFYAAFAGSVAAGTDGVWKSSTGATGSWTRIAGAGSSNNPAGWNAQGAYGRVVLAVAPSLESRVYALYYDNTSSKCAATPKPEAEFFYWNDSNSTWTDISATLPDEEPGCADGVDPFAAQRGYNLALAVKPDNADTIFIGGTSAYRSTNAGLNWTKVGGYANASNATQYENSHPDIHSFVFQPVQPGSPATTMLCGNDGGIQRTTDNLATTVAWTQINNGFRTYQYYYVANDPRMGNNKVIGGAQDNGTTRNINGTGNLFEVMFSGDGVSVGLSDPAATGGVQYEYVGVQNGVIFRRDAASPGFTGTSITPTGESGGLFITLFKLDSDNTERLYYVNKNKLYRTNSASTVTSSTWTEMTGIGTAVGTGVNITAIGLSRGLYNAATSSLFIGTSNGKVFRLDDPTGESGGLFITLFKLDSDNTERLYYVNKNKLYRTNSASTVTSSTWTQMTGIETAVGTVVNITAIGLSRGVYNPATSSLFIGTSNGKVFRLDDPTGVAATATPVDITGANFPAGAYVSSISTNPLNDDTALVTFSNYGVNSVFHTANANSNTFVAPAWTNVENNLPLPSYRSSAILNVGGTLEYFVGTSAGLFRITGLPAAGNWTQEGPGTIGNAVVSNLDLRVSDNKLLVGTHGIGMLRSAAPTAAAATVSGRVTTSTRRGVSGATVRLEELSGNVRTVRTNSTGYYRIENVEVGQSVVVSVSSKRYRFTDQVVNLFDSVTDIDFVAQNQFFSTLK